jgi:cholesterol transport system auxiliary component
MTRTVTRNTRARPLSHLLAALVLTASLSGCAPGLVAEKTAPPGIYLIDAPDMTPAAPPAEQPKTSISVGTVRSAPGYASTDMIYVTEPHHLQAFARHRWADRPARMLEPVLMNTLEASGLFARVAAPGSQAQARWHLDVELRRLQQVFTGPDSHVELVIRASLLETRQRRQRASQVFRLSIKAEPSPYGGVLAANEAAALFSEELVQFLRRTLR